MTNTSSSLTEGLNRQRRALVAVGLTLTFFVTAVGRIEHLDILGNSVPIEHPALALTFLWIAWLYLGLRYYQYFRQLGLQEWKSELRDRLTTLAKQHAKNAYLTDRDALATDERIVAAERHFLGIKIAEERHPLMEEDAETEWPESPILDTDWRVEITGSLVQTLRDGSQETSTNNWHGTVRCSDMRWPGTRAFFWNAIHRTSFTEHLLPFVVALSPVLALLVKSLA